MKVFNERNKSKWVAELVFTTLNYIERFLILGSTITGCISISAFASLVGIPIGITSSVIDSRFVQ